MMASTGLSGPLLRRKTRVSKGRDMRRSCWQGESEATMSLSASLSVEKRETDTSGFDADRGCSNDRPALGLQRRQLGRVVLGVEGLPLSLPSAMRWMHGESTPTLNEWRSWSSSRRSLSLGGFWGRAKASGGSFSALALASAECQAAVLAQPIPMSRPYCIWVSTRRCIYRCCRYGLVWSGLVVI